MANYPGALDAASTLYTPVDAFSAKPLETTTTGAVLAGDSTINVASTTGGFAATYGILSIDDELIVYTGKTGTQFTGCQRGAFGTAAAGHGNGVAVKANMVAGFITTLQSAVLAIENELGTAAARNYIRREGAVTVTGLKTFQDGAEFGAGAKSSTGLVACPTRRGQVEEAGQLRRPRHRLEREQPPRDGRHHRLRGGPDVRREHRSGRDHARQGRRPDRPGGRHQCRGGCDLALRIRRRPWHLHQGDRGRVGPRHGWCAPRQATCPPHPRGSDIVSGALAFAIQNNGAAVGTRRALNLIQGSGIGLTFLDVAASDRVNVTIALGAHTHAEADVTNLAADLAAKAPTVHTHAEADITGLVTDLAGKAASVHTHTSSQISDATATATAGKVVIRDGDGGANFAYAAANSLWAFQDSHLQSVECGAFQTVGGPYENMAKYSEDFSVATWDKNGGSCSVMTESGRRAGRQPDRRHITASTVTPVLQQNVAGLVDGGTYTFYVWARVNTGTKTASIAIVNNAYGAYLAGPMQVTLTTSWQRFKITGTLAGGQTALWIVVRCFAGNGDNWTSGDILPVGRVPPAGHRSEEGVRAHVGIPGRPRCGRNRVRAVAGRRQGHHRVAVQGARPWLPAHGPHAPRSHGGRRTDHRGRHRQRLPPRGDCGRE